LSFAASHYPRVTCWIGVVRHEPNKLRVLLSLDALTADDVTYIAERYAEEHVTMMRDTDAETSTSRRGARAYVRWMWIRAAVLNNSALREEERPC